MNSATPPNQARRLTGTAKTYGLDLRRTTPPITEIVDLVLHAFAYNPLLCAVQVYENSYPRILGGTEIALRLVGVASLWPECAGGEPRHTARRQGMDPVVFGARAIAGIQWRAGA